MTVKNRRVFFVLIIVAIFVVFGLFLQRAGRFSLSQKWINYTNSKYGFSIKRPSDFTFNEGYSNVSAIVWAAEITNPTAKPVSNHVRDTQAIYLGVQKKLDLNLDRWMEIACPTALSLIQDIQVSNKPAKKITCNQMETGRTIVVVPYENYYYYFDNMGYRRDPLQDKYFDQIVSSLQLK